MQWPYECICGILQDSGSCEVHLGVSVIGLFVKPKQEDSEKQTSYFK